MSLAKAKRQWPPDIKRTRKGNAILEYRDKGYWWSNVYTKGVMMMEPFLSSAQ